MKEFLGIVNRDLLRSFRSGLWYIAAATFYFSYAVYFDLLFSLAAGPQPQPISPVRSIFSGEMLLLWVLFIPVLVQKTLVEERQQRTWDCLVITGLSTWTLVLAKLFANLIQLLFWMTICSAFPIAFSLFIDIDVGALMSSMLMIFLVAIHWLSLCYLLLCKTKSFVTAYFKAGLVLLMYYLFPLFTVLLPDEFYRPIFETMDLRGMLDRASQGILLGHDLVWLIGGAAVFIIGAKTRLAHEVYLGLGKLKKGLFDGVFLLGCCFVLVFTLFVGHSRAWVLDVSPKRQGEISQNYIDLATRFPKGIEVTVALPEKWNVPSYDQARTCILAFLSKTQALVPEMRLKVLDPDIDVLAMHRLRESGGVSDNKIGFVSISLNDRRLNIPYHQWVSIGTMTIDNEPYRYLRSFKGEDQMVRSINNLHKDSLSGQVLVFSGHGELDPGQDGLLGGTEFLDLIRQFGLTQIRFKPDLDAIPNISDIKMMLILDPQTGLSDAFKKIMEQAFDAQIPILAAVGPSLEVFDPDSKSILKHYGILNSNGVIYQKHYRQYDPFTLPMAELSNPPMLDGLQKRVLLFECVSALREGIPRDPRLKVVPLLRTQTSPSIWDEHQYDPQDPLVRHSFGPNDKVSPLYTAMAAQWQTDSGSKPALVALGTRSIFENRWIHQGANRELLFQSIDWLLDRKGQVRLPPSIMSDYKIEASPIYQLWVQAIVTFVPPFVLLALGFYHWKRKQ